MTRPSVLASNPTDPSRIYQPLRNLPASGAALNCGFVDGTCCHQVMHMTHSPAFYYDALLWAAILYGAGVLFKFGSVFLYEALMPWFTEDEPGGKKAAPKKRPPPLPQAKRVAWWGLGLYLLLAGLAAIPPQVSLSPKVQLFQLPMLAAQRGIGRSLAHGWVNAWWFHAITYNIVILMFELLLGIFLLTERGTLLGRITAGAAFVWGIFVGIFPQGLGYLATTRNSLLSGAPGSGFLVAGLALMLLVPSRIWERPSFTRTLMGAWTLVIGLGTLWQVFFFSADRLARLYAHGPSLTPSWLSAVTRSIQTASSHDAALFNIFWLVLFAAAALSVRVSGLFGCALASLIWLAIWWFGQGFGLMAAFALNLNSAPLWGILLWTICTLRQTVATGH